jgi:hypothetical protein
MVRHFNIEPGTYINTWGFQSESHMITAEAFVRLIPANREAVNDVAK